MGSSVTGARVVDTSDVDTGDAERPFETLPGDPSSCVLLHVPHSSANIPLAVREHLLLNDEALEHEIHLMRDSHTDVVASAAARRARLRPTVFVNQLARQVVDPERFPDDREVMARIGHGAVYHKTSQLEPLRTEDPLRDRELLDRYFHPYANALSQTTDDIRNRLGKACIVDVHSFPKQKLPYEINDGPRPQICIGTDNFHTPGWLRAAAQQSFCDVGLEVDFDSPFAGTYIPLDFYQRDQRVTGVMIEIRRDLGDSEESFDRVCRALTTLIDSIDNTHDS